MSCKNLYGLVIIILALTVFSTASTAAWDGYRIVNNFNASDSGFETAESTAFNCLDSDCNDVGTFGGSYPFGKTSSQENITIDYPADLQDHGYAVYFFSPGYVPMEYHDTFYCESGTYCGPANTYVTFYKIDECSSTIDSLSVTNEIYKNEPVTVDVTAALDSTVQSAFEDADTGVGYVPPDYKDQYYSAKTDVTLEITDESGNQVYTDQKQLNIYMSEQDKVQFEWTPSEEGNYTIRLITDVVDEQCSSSVQNSAEKEIVVQPERPQDEYYTIINDLDIQDNSPQAGDTQTFNYNKISNYADENYDKYPVGTEATYTVTDSDGIQVYSSSKTLPANSNPTDPEWFSFTWTPESSGTYTAKVEGIAEEDYGSAPNPADSNAITFSVDPEPTFDVKFQVSDSDGNDLSDAEVSMAGETSTTDSYGIAYIKDLKTGDYSYMITKTGYQSKEGTISITESSPSTIDEVVTLHEENTAPTITDIPDVSMLENSESSLDLDEYVSDEQSPDSDLSWSYTGNQNIAVTISSDHIATFTPDTDWTGSETIDFTVQDPGGLEASDSMTATVSDVNNPPVVESIPDVSLNEDEALYDKYYLGSYISDEETSFSNLITTVNADKEGCGVYEDSEDYINIAPDTDWHGTCQVNVTAEDSEGATDHETFTVTVNSVNDAPVITSSPVTEIDAFSEYRYQMKVTDDDGDSISYNIAEGPSDLTVSSTGEVLWDYPTNDDSGTHSITLEASDGQATDTQSYDLTVNEVETNDKPIASASSNVTKGSAPLTVSFDGSESYDPDGTISSYEWSFGEGGKDYGSAVEYTYTEPGNFTAVLTVTDDDGSTDTDSILIEVSGNKEPYFTSDPITTGKENIEYSYDADATDPEGQDITYSLVESPSDMGIDSNNGMITWTPTQAGDYSVKIKAADTKGGEATQTFTITVSENQDPYFTSDPVTDGVANQKYTYDANAEDPDGSDIDYLLEQYPQNMIIDPFTGEIEWTPGDKDIGDHSISIIAEDVNGNQAKQQYTLTVHDDNPSVSADSNTTSGIVPLTVELTAAASDYDGTVESYEWDFGDGSSDSGQTVIHTYSSTGDYTATVTVTDNDGKTGNDTVSITVSENHPPEITSKPSKEVEELEKYEYQVTADDPDGNTVEFYLDQSPENMTIDTSTGLVEWTPSEVQNGNHTVTVTAEDSLGASTSQTYDLRVTDNTAPNPPTNLLLSPINSTSVFIDWSLSSSRDVEGYHVYRRNDSSSYDFSNPISTASSASDSTVDTGLETNSTYYYIVRAFDDYGNEETNRDSENITTPTYIDSDGDGLPDWWEVEYNTTENLLDPEKNDTDGDGTADGEEDPDEDNLTNLEEYELGTNPNKKDTDGDGLPDGWEYENGLDPLDDDSDNDGTADGEEDPDGDNLTNSEEYELGTDPNDSDTDGDGVSDGEDECPLRGEEETGDVDSDGCPISTSSTTDDGGGGGGGFSITSEEEENEDPTADAGGDLTAFVGEEIVLQGSGSDPDGSIIQYRWDFENDGEWDYVSEDSGTATAVYDRTGVYTAVFQVEDDENALSNDTARIEVFESTGNLEGIKSNFTASNDTLINYQYNSKSKTTSIEFTEENNFDTTKILELNLTLSEELEEHLSEFTITPSPEKIQERPRENSTANSTVITWRMDMEPNSSRTINISSDNYISRKTWEGIELSRDWEDSKTTTPTGFITRNRMGIIGVLLALFIALVVYVFWKREQEKLKKEEPYDKQVWEAVERLKRKIREEKY